ncbi:MAG: serine/threonine protein kinase [Myxococcales bacterium]|nr:serine/threonine protein kinase [Myxococcales bacterium]
MRYCPTCGRRFEEVLLFCPDDGVRTLERSDDEVTREIAVPDKLIGRTIDGRYRVETKIGEGGMGNVYLATHVVLNRKLALKVLAGDMARNPEVVARFQQEAQSATAIGHQNIIDIVDFGALPDTTAYFVMEYLDGKSLTSLLEAGEPPPADEIIHIVRQIAEALSAAHARGIVHRDLKPDNIFVIRRGDSDRFVKVLDFGIAKVGGAASKLTQTGVIFGTPHYMAPEQAAGQAVDHRADIYSLGIILYELCVGQVPFDADTYMGILSKHMFEPPPVDPTVVEGRGLGAFRPMILKALAKKPEDRYQSMEELIADLDLVAEGGMPAAGTARSVGATSSVPPALPGGAGGRGKIVAAVLGAGVLLGVGGWLVMGSGSRANDADATGASASASPSTPSEPPASQEPAAPEPTPAAAAAEPEPTAPKRVRIESEPSKAEVWRDNSILGNTPYEYACPEPEKKDDLAIMLQGYQRLSVTISSASCETDALHLQLAKEPTKRKAASKPAAAAPAAAPKPKRRSSGEIADPFAD